MTFNSGAAIVGTGSCAQLTSRGLAARREQVEAAALFVAGVK